MDLSDSAELQALFRDEVVVRAAALAAGSKEMAADPLDSTRLTDLRRDAHTIKGNALVMGYPHMAEAARVIEQALREMDEVARAQSPELADAIGSLSDLLPGAIDEEKAGEPQALLGAVRRLSDILDGKSRPTPGPPAPPGAPTTRQPEPHSHPEPSHVESLSDDSGSESAGFEPPPRDNFGGLTAELEMVLESESTRVDSGRLYQLINKVVELRLDAEALVHAAEALDREIARTGATAATTVKMRNLEAAADRFHGGLTALESSALVLPSVPFGEVTSTFDQLVRFLSRRLNKDVTLHVIGDDVSIDRQLVDRLREPLRHLVVNAVDHGIESAAHRIEADKPPTGSVIVEVAKIDHQIHVSVSDDGRGIDWESVTAAAERHGLPVDQPPSAAELQSYLFVGGLSTVEEHSDVSGDGTGLAMAAELVESLNGGIAVASTPNHGTTVRMTLPSSLALQGVMIIEAGGYPWGIPLAAVDTTVVVVGESVDGVRYQDTDLPVQSLAGRLGLPTTAPTGEVIVITARGGLQAFGVERVIGRRQVAVKDLGPVLGGNIVLGGAAVLGGGQVIGILDPAALSQRGVRKPSTEIRPHLLVVDDSRGARQLVSAALGSAGFDITVAGDAGEAIVALDKEDFDAVVCDFSMPGHSGVELVGLLRKRLPELPVVMVSAVATPEDQSAAYAAGVNAYLDKSDFREGVLAQTLRSLLGMPDQRRVTS